MALEITWRATEIFKNKEEEAAFWSLRFSRVYKLTKPLSFMTTSYMSIGKMLEDGKHAPVMESMILCSRDKGLHSQEQCETKDFLVNLNCSKIRLHRNVWS